MGLRRTNNEDFVLENGPVGLFLLADGMGGHQAGEKASRLALESINNFFVEYETASAEETNSLQTFPSELPMGGRKLIYSIIRANTIVTESAQLDKELDGMGTTVVALYADREELFAAHVGDSRIYMLRGGKLSQVTEDHSFYFEELKKGFFTKEQLDAMPFKNRLTRALGHMGKAKVDMKVIHPRAGDLFLLCSDGLTDMMGDDDIRVIMAEASSLETCAHALVEKAKANGGLDNVSVLLVRIDGL